MKDRVDAARCLIECPIECEVLMWRSVQSNVLNPLRELTFVLAGGVGCHRMFGGILCV